MGVSRRLGKAVLKRIEASPRVQAQIARSERTAPVTRAAHKAAFSSLDDEAAKTKLGEQLKAEPHVAEALAHFHRPDDYIGDRAYRLLAAAAADTPMEPIPPARAELFAQEESIGRMPIEQAFQKLAAIEPGLLGLQGQAEAVAKNGDPRSCNLPKHIKEPLHRLVGGGSRNLHEILHTNLATSIVHQYLETLAGNTRFGTPDIAYFDSPTKHFVATGVLFDFRRSKPHRA